MDQEYITSQKPSISKYISKQWLKCQEENEIAQAGLWSKFTLWNTESNK